MHCLPDAFMEDAPTVRWNSEAWQYSTTCPRLLYKVHRYWWNYYSQNVGTKSFRAWLRRCHSVTTLDRLINLLILCHAFAACSFAAPLVWNWRSTAGHTGLLSVFSDLAEWLGVCEQCLLDGRRQQLPSAARFDLDGMIARASACSRHH